MKPDGVATTPAEPQDDVVEPVPEEAAGEAQAQQDSSPSSQPVMTENEGDQEGANSTLPPTGKEVDGKFSKPKGKTQVTGKSKPSTAGAKARTTSNAASRPVTTQSRVANDMKITLSGTSKKHASMTSEIKKCGGVAASAQVKKVPTTTTVAPKTQVKAADQKAVMTSRPVSSTSSGMRKTVASSSALSTKSVTGGSNAAVKPKTTAPRPIMAPAAKASIPAASKAGPIPKTTRTTVATGSRPTTSTSVRPTSTASKALRTTVSTHSATHSAFQPSKVSSTVTTKDIKSTTSAAARKPLASTTRSTVTKTSKPEPPKTGTAARRLPMDNKTTQPKVNESRQVSTRKVPSSHRNISSQLASGKMAAELSNHKQGASNLVSMKHQTTKPKQVILPSVVKEKALQEQFKPLESSENSITASVTTAAITAVELVTEVAPALPLLESQTEELNVPVPEPSSIDNVSTKEPKDAEPIAVQPVANAHVMSKPPAVVPESEVVHDNILDMVPMAEEIIAQKPISALPYEVQITVQVPPKDSEAGEKQEQIVCNVEEEEEEERECSQQVSVSDMSGTQPTEESRPGSAGLAGSLWRAGGLPSEFDSEDVSCSQQGASELSAPGVLEGTESMDDLGEASLKGGDGASAGSPDFEKFPDIPVNEDEEEEDEEEEEEDDHVDDMEVGSEMTEDPQRQCNDNEDEDEDVEMASEGITESGLESYGNADEDDLAEDYRLDNLNRMQHSSIVFNALSAANPFADTCLQSLQSGPSLVSSPSSNPEQMYSEFPSRPVAHACLDIETVETALSSLRSPSVLDPVQISTLPSSEPAAEIDLGLKQGLASYSQCISQSSTLLGPELVIHTCSNASTLEELKDRSISPGLENKKPLQVSPVPVALPDIIGDLGSCKFDHAGSEHEDEEPETLPADDMLVGLSVVTTSAPSSHSSATGDEASDTEGDMQISDPTEPGSTGNECFDSVQIVHSMSELVEQSEQACVEVEGGGGDTPQSATSVASYGFECTTSNSNAQSTTESCIKSPGIFSLENEEQFLDEAKDPSLKEVNLAPADNPTDTDFLDQQAEHQLNSEQQYIPCGQASEETAEPCSLEGTIPIEKGLDTGSSLEQQQELDLGTPHPHYSTTSEKTDSFLTGCVTTAHTRAPKHRSVLRVDHVMRLPSDLPPRMPIGGCNAQLLRLERHQQQLEEIEQRQQQRSQSVERQTRECEGEKKERNQTGVLEQNEEEGAVAFEEQGQDLLRQQIQQQQEEEMKHRQQIMQWQQELKQHEEDQHQNSHQKNLTPVLLSPSGLCTIYEARETSDAEDDIEDQMKESEMVLKIKVEHECEKRSSNPETRFRLHHSPDSPQSHRTSTSRVIQEHKQPTSSVTVDSPALSGSNLPEQSLPLELDWSKKADIVQQLINQTLFLNGDNCSPHMLLSGGAAGTLSPLETSLWPNLPPLTPPSATVTSVSSFSAEISGSSPQGEWMVVELETHH